MSNAEYPVPEGVGNPLRYLIRRYATPHAPRFVLAAFGNLLAQIPQRVPALVVGVALDAILLGTTQYTLPGVPQGWIPTGQGAQVTFTIALLTVAYVLDTGITWFSGRISGTARLRTLHDIRVDTFDALVDYELPFFDDRQTGDVMSVLNNDVSNLSGFGNNALQGIRFVMQILVAFAFMATLHVRLAVLLLVLPVGLALIARWYTTRVEPVYESVRKSVGQVNSRLEDSIDGVATVKAFAQEDREREAVAGASREYRDRNWSVIRLRILFDLGSWSLSAVCFIGLFALGTYMNLGSAPAFLGEPLTAGTLLTFLLYSKSFYGPIRQLMLDVLDSYENALSSSKRIVSVIEGERAGRTAGEELEISAGRIEYDDVTFAYEGAEEPTLKDVSFEAEPGSLIGVVGPTGAGKSTITKLLFKFYEPDAGEIRIDGQSLENVSRASLREHLGYVSQDPFLFYGTIRENIGYGLDQRESPENESEASGSKPRSRAGSEGEERPANVGAGGVDDGKIERAAELAGAADFIAELEDGYDTQVGERGESLSGGQRQRIAIARALLREPEILVLDEATSHVDNETERQIQESIDALAGERTTVAIAHRLSTVRNAERILVVDGGEIVERGTHEELVAEDGLYADLWRVQVGETEAVSDAFLRADAVEGVHR